MTNGLRDRQTVELRLLDELEKKFMRGTVCGLKANNISPRILGTQRKVCVKDRTCTQDIFLTVFVIFESGYQC